MNDLTEIRVRNLEKQIEHLTDKLQVLGEAWFKVVELNAGVTNARVAKADVSKVMHMWEAKQPE